MTYGKLWTESEKAELLALRAQGFSASRIASALGRTRNSVCGAVERMLEDGRQVPPAVVTQRGGRAKGLPKPRVLPNIPFWEMAEDDRRLALWRRAKTGAHKALQDAF